VTEYQGQTSDAEEAIAEWNHALEEEKVGVG